MDFQPGSTAFLEGETNKLDKLASALAQRPALNLEIETSVDPVSDRDALARQKLRRSLREDRLRELADTGQRPPPDVFVLDDANFQRLLRAGLAREFGTNLSEALKDYTAAQAAAHATAATNRALANAQLSRPKGLLRTAYYYLPIHGKHSAIGAAKRQAKADAALLKQNPELVNATEDDLEGLLASRTEVTTEEYLRLMQDRARALQARLQQTGQIAPDRLYLMAPKAPDPTKPTLSRATLTLN